MPICAESAVGDNTRSAAAAAEAKAGHQRRRQKIGPATNKKRSGGSRTVKKGPGPAPSKIKPKTTHGNSESSPKPQHRYEISDQSGDVVKTGISGGTLNKDGMSSRANRQVNKLNKSKGAGSTQQR